VHQCEARMGKEPRRHAHPTYYAFSGVEAPNPFPIGAEYLLLVVVKGAGAGVSVRSCI
jgi:hypothetical protein